MFLERGIRATTADVAERAGISEGAIFHRFRSKDALFRAAMRFDPEQLPDVIATLPSRVGEPDLRATLVDVATRMLEVGRVALPVMMMSWSNPAGEYALAKLPKRTSGYGRVLRAVRAFFEGEVESGRLRPAAPDLLARIFMGSLHHYCWSEILLGSSGATSPRDFAEGLVDVLFRAASYEEPRPARARKTARPRPTEKH